MNNFEPIWEGRIRRLSGDQIEIDNFLTRQRTTCGGATNFIDFCSTSRFVFLRLDDGTIFQLEDDVAGFAIKRKWAFCNDQSRYSSSSDLIGLSVTRSHCPAIEQFSHFGLSVVENGFRPMTNDSTDLIACAEKYLFIAHSKEPSDSSLNVLSQVDLISGEVSIVSDFLPPDVYVRNLKCGYAHVVILDSLGCVRTFGFGTRGELGHGVAESETRPTVVHALVGVRIRVLSVGGWHTVAITEFGDAYVWGWNADGQLGFDKEITPSVLEPTHLDAFSDVAVCSVACGSRHTVFLLENHDVHACGWNGYGQIGEKKERETGLMRQIHFEDKKVIAVNAFSWSSVLCVGI